jgi:phenylalanyl-tRNA synthetase beta chain
VLTVTVPSWRATKDISIADDLVEEVGRMIGYGSITPTAPKMAVTPPPINTLRAFHNRCRRALAYYGFTEVHNYSFVSDAEAQRFGFDPATHVRVLNPIAEDQALLRVSLIPQDSRQHRRESQAFGGVPALRDRK